MMKKDYDSTGRPRGTLRNLRQGKIALKLESYD